MDVRQESIQLNLRDFIKATLVQIAEGIDEANLEFSEGWAGRIKGRPIANPHDMRSPKTDNVFALYKEDKDGISRIVEQVHFDVAVGVAEGKGKKAQLGVFASVLTLGGEKGSDSQSTAQSRIRFSIPMLLPQPDPGGQYERST